MSKIITGILAALAISAVCTCASAEIIKKEDVVFYTGEDAELFLYSLNAQYETNRTVGYAPSPAEGSQISTDDVPAYDDSIDMRGGEYMESFSLQDNGTYFSAKPFEVDTGTFMTVYTGQPQGDNNGAFCFSLFALGENGSETVVYTSPWLKASDLFVAAAKVNGGSVRYYTEIRRSEAENTISGNLIYSNY